MGMTPEQRAEKIQEELQPCMKSCWLCEDHKKYIAAQIADAVREAVEGESIWHACDQRAKDEYKKGFEDGKLEGRASMREEAAAMVTGLDHCDFNGHSCTQDIVEQIRAIALEGK